MKTLKLLSLEPRVLLDAAGAATAADTHADVAEQTDSFEKTQQEYVNTEDSSSDSLLAPVAPATSQTEPGAQWDLVNSEDAHLGQVQAHEVVVVDTSIQDYQVLLENVNPDAEILYIDPTRDGITQVADALRGRNDISALHILSHGSEGTLALGTSLLNADTIADYQDELEQIGNVFVCNPVFLRSFRTQSQRRGHPHQRSPQRAVINDDNPGRRRRNFMKRRQ